MKDFIVEINPSNEVILNLNSLRKEDPKLASQAVKMLYDTALFQSNIPIQGKDFAKRSFYLLKTLMEFKLHNKGEEKSEELPVERMKEEVLKDFKDDVKGRNADIFDDFKIKK